MGGSVCGVTESDSSVSSSSGRLVTLLLYFNLTVGRRFSRYAGDMLLGMWMQQWNMGVDMSFITCQISR
jgi:hypothetical protein